MDAERVIREEELLAQMVWVRRLAEVLVRDPHAAADLAQETWLVARAKALGRPWSIARLRSWLAAVARRTAHTNRRGDSRRLGREEHAAQPEAQPSAYEIVARSAHQTTVARAVHALDEPYRSTILYRYLDELTTAEIAQRMDTTEETTRQRLTRGRRVLRQRLERAWPDGAHAGLLAILGLPRVEPPLLVTSALPLAAGGLAVAAAVTVLVVRTPEAAPPGADLRAPAVTAPVTPVAGRAAGEAPLGEQLHANEIELPPNEGTTPHPPRRIASGGRRTVVYTEGEFGASLEVDVEETTLEEAVIQEGTAVVSGTKQVPISSKPQR